MRNNGFIRCAIATFNGKLSNPKYNAQKIKDLIAKATESKAKLLVLSELSMTGYSCQDLFYMSNIIEASNKSLKDIAMYTNRTDLLVLVGAPIRVNDDLYDCAVAIQFGEIIGIVPKRYLNINELYEKRWFSEYSEALPKTIEFGGRKIPFGNIIFTSSLGFKVGVEIGEDLNSVIPPSSYLAISGANIIANLAASNELVGKDQYRRELIKTQSSRNLCAYLYTSAGFSESTSDVVFGGSGYAYECGKKLVEFERFNMNDEMKVLDIDIEYITSKRATDKSFRDSKQNVTFNFTNVDFRQTTEFPRDIIRILDPYPFVPNIMSESGSNTCNEIIQIQSTGLARRLSEINCSKVTLGISGGLDSTLALLVAVEAFKKLNLDAKGIIGITMPGFGTTDRTYTNAVKLCETLGITLLEIPIRDACIQHFKDIDHDISVHDITYENVQARERTQILMDMANKHNALLVGTGDLSESVLGWCTYNGDHMSMYNVNCSIPKTLVKTLIRWYANCKSRNNELYKILMDIISTPISPELLPTDGKTVVQKTESAVGPYEVIDFFIYHLLKNKYSGEKIVLLAKYAFRDKYSEEQLIKYYNDFIKRFFRNQFKRNCVPDGPKVGSVAVSPRGDLKMPSDADYSNWIIK